MTNNGTEEPRQALITGGSMGLGLTLAGFLAAQGVDLIITARDSSRLQVAKEKLAAFGVVVNAIPGDVADPTHRRRLAEAVLQRGGLDILVNNASTLGHLPMPSLVEYPLEALRQAFEVNTIAPLALVQLMQKDLSRRSGLVVNISSDAAIGGYEGWGGYGASKAALDLVSSTMANELQDVGISVVSVDPGDMQTAMHQNAYPGSDISDLPSSEVTLPFWAWLFGQDPTQLSGRRLQAQAELWEVAA